MDHEDEAGRVLSPAGPEAPNPARMYAYWLGGKDYYAVDRRAADRIAALAPWVVAAARANRAFVNRAVAVMAREGITQFLDIGCGLPAAVSVHEVAQRTVPDARVVYVDRDEVVLVHARALLETDPGVAVVPGDARRPAELLRDPRTLAHLDLSRPVGVVLAAVLHFLDDEEAESCMAGLRSALATGSCVAISHACLMEPGDGGGDPAGEHRTAATEMAARLYSELVGPCWLRSRAQIAALFGGLALLDPGLVDVDSWRRLPGRSRLPLPVLAGVGRSEA